MDGGNIYKEFLICIIEHIRTHILNHFSDYDLQHGEKQKTKNYPQFVDNINIFVSHFAFRMHDPPWDGKPTEPPLILTKTLYPSKFPYFS